jgi:hypothetical protein
MLLLFCMELVFEASHKRGLCTDCICVIVLKGVCLTHTHHQQEQQQQQGRAVPDEEEDMSKISRKGLGGTGTLEGSSNLFFNSSNLSLYVS